MKSRQSIFKSSRSKKDKIIFYSCFFKIGVQIRTVNLQLPS
ncbi:hypothetical protein HMPREF1548_03667 [Clostridium sp. KLE 1755]|nr:hypothetical protein HMPREF1548_03667 [Clostridium sp. KLE 1755]